VRGEREIRRAKSRVKVSGSMRSEYRARAFLRIRSYLQTMRKHGIDCLQTLTDLFECIPWLPEVLATPATAPPDP
jgi:hypothetical protein